MKRIEIVGKLMKEGFSEKTLVNFTDNQLTNLSKRILGEATQRGSVVMPKTTTNPMDVKKMTDQGLNVELREKELKGGQKKIDANKNGKIDAEDFKMLLKKKKSTDKCPDCGKDEKDCKCDHTHMDESKPSAGLSKEKKSEVVKKAKKGGDIGKKGKGFEKIVKKAKESGADDPEAVAAAAMWKNIKREGTEVKNWVKNLVETKQFHSFTSKNEIMELIETKMNETHMGVEHGPKVKKGHNGVPEFMSYDAIVAAAEPTTKPAPTKDPGTKTPPKKDPRKTPFQPGPGPNPKPKALKETK